MSTHHTSRTHLTLQALLVAAGLSLGGGAIAGTSGLGQHWPNAPDVSASPHYHVYVFQRDGVRYIQVNDLGGHVRQAVATAGDQIMVLPMGEDADRVSTPDAPATDAPATTSETVYDDGAVKVTTATDAAGATTWAATPASAAATGPCKPPECYGVQSATQ